MAATSTTKPTATKAQDNGKVPDVLRERARIAAGYGNFKPTSTTSPRDHAKIEQASRRLVKKPTAEALAAMPEPVVQEIAKTSGLSAKRVIESHRAWAQQLR